MSQVSIAVLPEIFNRFADLKFEPSQAIAEFIDNAIQSYLDYKNNGIFYHPGYKLKIDVFIEWDEPHDNKTFAKSITIEDNAAGIALSRYEKAFETGARPAFNEGLNEYGMGMKTAAYWLSKQWTIVTKAFSENIERTLSFDVDQIVNKQLKFLEFDEKTVPGNQSYTIVRLEKLHQHNNFTKRMLPGIKADLASIYRAFLRRDEIQINVDGEALFFKEHKLLNAPWYLDEKGTSIEWKTQISCNMFGKEINGFIGLLDEMSEKHSGLVVMRRGRVIVGESSEHLFHPESLFGSYKNGFLYKRLYGEIEIKGFRASFNKNGFSNTEELETMLKLQKDKLKVCGYSLIKQATEYRVKPKPANQYSVRWVFNNGNPDLIESYQANSSLKIPETPKKQGFAFNGWTPTLPLTVIENLEFNAQWRIDNSPKPIRKFEIRWVFDNGQMDLVECYNEGEKLVEPTKPEKKGWQFNGWIPSIKSSVGSNAVYTAQWKESRDEVPAKNILASKVFQYQGKTRRVDLINNQAGATLLSLDMTNYETKGIVVGLINSSRLSIDDKQLRNQDVKNLLLSIAIGMFEAQMDGEDTCEGLMKRIR